MGGGLVLADRMIAGLLAWIADAGFSTSFPARWSASARPRARSDGRDRAQRRSGRGAPAGGAWCASAISSSPASTTSGWTRRRSPRGAAAWALTVRAAGVGPLLRRTGRLPDLPACPPRRPGRGLAPLPEASRRVRERWQLRTADRDQGRRAGQPCRWERHASNCATRSARAGPGSAPHRNREQRFAAVEAGVMRSSSACARRSRS